MSLVSEEGSIPEVDDPILEIRGASVTFDMTRGESRVLDEVNLDVDRQEILGVVGESGSGKSMFASAMLDAVVDPGRVSGDVQYYPADGEPKSILELPQEELKSVRWEEISMVFQGAMSSFNPTMTIRGHFVETLKAHGYEKGPGMEHARSLLEDLYLEPDRVLDSYPHELSGGMSQRALIALSLLLEPEVLIMDEPTAALDLLMQRSILGLLDDLQEAYDLTVVFITHDLPLVAGLADRLAVMYAFEFAEIGPADEIVDYPTHPYTRSLLRAVPNLDAPLSEMRPIEGSAPDPVDVPSGCSYHPRCSLATEECREYDPGYHDVSAAHKTTCFHWEEAEAEIPLEFDLDPSEVERYEGKQSDAPIVSAQDLSVHFTEDSGFLNLFGEPDTVQAVDGVDLDIYENDVVALVGESGCGKTTLGKTLIAAQRPTSGSVEYRGQDVWAAKDRESDVEIPYKYIRPALQMVHQNPGSSLNSNRTVKASLVQPLKKWRPDMNAEQRSEHVHNLLEHVGMTPAEDYAGRYPHQLSGGEKQRVALIRALLLNPDLILADEAVSALDVSLRVEVMDLMLELQEVFGTSYLFISHNLSNARYFAGKAGGRIGVMYLGEIVEIAPAEELIRNPQHPYTKVLLWSTASLDEAGVVEEPPIRGIDIPDPVDPPSGCRFHTRCPEAREVCRERSPSLDLGEEDHGTACFLEADEDHPYWNSESIVEAADESAIDRPTPEQPTSE
ncbi:ABC transporter ATP-binding protein [Halosimplex amylolyticum]|uniref:ABC transporter ATP-binding protein n=1 Tax=Halosimplex amylolyticum TaxID=3396616 RepID=UPI003F5669D5